MRFSKNKRERILNRDHVSVKGEPRKFRCARCRYPLDRYETTLDHVIPKLRHWDNINHDDNLQILCEACQNRKGHHEDQRLTTNYYGPLVHKPNTKK